MLFWVGSGKCKQYVPKTKTLRTDIIRYYHGHGHLGINKTYTSVTKALYWPKLYEDVEAYVNGCLDCQKNKRTNALPSGPLQRLPVPERCWDVVAADFLAELPEGSSGNDAILVIVDKLSKRAIFTPLKKTAIAQEVA